ncbi:unnamed protein product [Angiostrongylus costaricensis]|uniref:Cyclin N-terminal domain-containing protein n=1 Tax=Angiostrongylus costaricensis TaxID=334426 RepID=A0A158PIY4_ANGCS|nr:unnamed protein product [Angiostrongylus costaricensis]
MTTLAEKRSLALAKAQAFVRTRKPNATTAAKNDQNGGETAEASVEDKNPIRPSSFGLRPHFSTLHYIISSVSINCDKWYQTMDEKARLMLQDPPSLADGMDRETEKHTVMACLLLASKIEEEPRRTRDVYNVFYRLEQLHKLRDSGRVINEYMIKAERRLLATLGFVVHVKHPHKLICAYCFVLRAHHRTDLIQKAWTYMNDGLRTDMFVRYSPETIACACIFLAARTVQPQVPLPDKPRNWLVHLNASI